jgi:hypothetical protein
MVTGHVHYVPNRIRHLDGIKHRKVNFTALRITRKLTLLRVLVNFMLLRTAFSLLPHLLFLTCHQIHHCCPLSCLSYNIISSLFDYSVLLIMSCILFPQWTYILPIYGGTVA